MKNRGFVLVPLLAAALMLLTAALPARAAAPQDKNPDFWYEKGALASTYGGDRAAVRFFEKVVSLDPDRSEAWFQMAVSYGELRWFDKAVEAADRAIELRPDAGLYYYGRGRIYLMLGAEDEAMADFKQAAGLGNPEAQQYLLRRQQAR
jgi:tetratricopeptide (TPR) repeat protein